MKKTDPELLSQNGFTQVCMARDVPEFIPKSIQLHGQTVLICRQNEALYAVDSLCPHQLKPMNYGIVMDGALTCPHHQYRFNLETGLCHVRRCAPLKTYALVVDDNQQVWINVPDPNLNRTLDE